MKAEKMFQMAEGYLTNGADAEAAVIYKELAEVPGISGLCHFRLGEIANRAGEPGDSLKYHTLAFEHNPRLASQLTQPDHIAHNYVYSVTEEQAVADCTLCGKRGTPHSVYNCVTSGGFFEGFNPIRTWMYCDSCVHMWAHNYPANLQEVLSSSAPPLHLGAKPRMFVVIGRSLQSVVEMAPEMTLLEVGTGGGEYAAVALEMGFDVTGIDIREAYARSVEKQFGIPVLTTDFFEYDEDRKFGVVTLGDVLEHFEQSPEEVLSKARGLLVEGGLLHISTPNFQSAYCMALGDRDPMWRVLEHINYFSRTSITNLLAKLDMVVERYELSPRYNGSMEIIARVKS